MLVGHRGLLPIGFTPQKQQEQVTNLFSMLNLPFLDEKVKWFVKKKVCVLNLVNGHVTETTTMTTTREKYNRLCDAAIIDKSRYDINARIPIILAEV